MANLDQLYLFTEVILRYHPRLSPGGILIIDDYGEWEGSKKATDEYLEQHNIPLHLIRVDVGARMGVKPT